MCHFCSSLIFDHTQCQTITHAGDRGDGAAQQQTFFHNTNKLQHGVHSVSVVKSTRQTYCTTHRKIMHRDTQIQQVSFCRSAHSLDITVQQQPRRAGPSRPVPLLDKPADPHADRYGYQDPNAYQQPQRGYNDRPYDQQPAAYDSRGQYDRPPERGREFDRAGPAQSDRYGYEPQGSGHQGGGNRYDSRDNYSRDDRYYDDRGGRGGPPQAGYGADAGGGGHGGQLGAVVMIYGLHADKMNCDRLFNLFCLYGNVSGIKYLKTKEGSAMVQMGDVFSMRKAVEHLNGLVVFGQKLSVASSRQDYLKEVNNPYPMKDGTPSYKDYTGDRLNRFTTPELASKNRITPPSRCLHFFNAPAGFTEKEIEDIYNDANVPLPRITIMHGKSDRSTSGFIEWDDLDPAVDALILTNHIELPNKKGSHPYIFKVCFTQPHGSQFSRGGPPRHRDDEARGDAHRSHSRD